MSSLADSVRICAERDAAHHVGQVAGRGVGGEDLVELVLGDRGELDLDPGLLGEGVDDLLGRGHPVGEVLLDPDGDACRRHHRLRRSVVGAAGGEARRPRPGRSREGRRPGAAAGAVTWTWSLR